MKIFYLTPLIPYPPLQGNQITGMGRLKCLSKEHQVTLVCFFYDKMQIELQLKELEQYCHKIIPVYQPKWRSLLNVVTGFFFSNKPLQLSYYHSAKLKKLVQSINAGEYDIIHVNTLRMEQFVYPEMPTPLLIDLYDSMILNIQSRLKKEKGLYKYIYTSELNRIKKYETGVVKNYSHLMVAAEQDKAIHDNNPKIEVIHLGVDMDVFKRLNPFPANQVIIFSGNMGYTPNIDAAVWFIENCWQRILQQVPGATFKIVGANPGKQLEKYRCYKGIQITGKVESMAAALNEAQLAIAPLKSGSGMQNKILEAMACSLPVVCTSIGLGSINAVNGDSILVTDDADQFAQLCIELLQDPEKCKATGRNALSVIENFYSIQYHSKSLENLYKKAILKK